MGQQLVQYRPLFRELGEAGFQPLLAEELNVSLTRPVRDEGIRVVKTLIERAGVFRAVRAELDASVRERAARDAAALVALPAAAAGAMAAQVHGAQAAVEPAERKAGLISCKAFHAILLTGCRMTVFSFSGRHRRASLR